MNSCTTHDGNIEATKKKMYPHLKLHFVASDHDPQARWSCSICLASSISGTHNSLGKRSTVAKGIVPIDERQHNALTSLYFTDNQCTLTLLQHSVIVLLSSKIYYF